VSSPRTAERLSRLLAMLPWVVANPGTTIQELQERFGYGRRADLIRDLNLVFVCGLPGYGPGDLMDLTIDDDEVYVDLADYFGRPLRLTATEGLILLSAGLAVLSSGTAPRALETAVSKLQAVIAADDDVLDVDLEPEPGLVDVLRRAATEARVVEITHVSMASGKTTTREIEPWGVFTTLGNWYVSGHCRLAAAERVFRIDRIREFRLLDEAFEPPPVPPSPVVAYTPGPDDVTARIRLSPQATWVADYYPVVTVSEDDDGSMVVDFSTADPVVAARILLRLGSEAELVEGAAVATATEDLRTRILRRYGAGDER
jgi:proteasome accessory factor C